MSRWRSPLRSSRTWVAHPRRSRSALRRASSVSAISRRSAATHPSAYRLRVSPALRPWRSPSPPRRSTRRGSLRPVPSPNSFSTPEAPASPDLAGTKPQFPCWPSTRRDSRQLIVPSQVATLGHPPRFPDTGRELRAPRCAPSVLTPLVACRPHGNGRSVTMAQSAGLHEPADLLDGATIDRHRALTSIEALEAVDWYDQRVAVTHASFRRDRGGGGGGGGGPRLPRRPGPRRDRARRASLFRLGRSAGSSRAGAPGIAGAGRTDHSVSEASRGG